MASEPGTAPWDSGDRAFRRAEAPAFFAGGAVQLLSRDGRALKLEGTGRRLWELLEYPIRFTDLCARLAAEYDGDEGHIAADVRVALDGLARRRLLDVVAAPSVEHARRHQYLWLLKRALVNLLYPEHELRIEQLETTPPLPSPLEQQRLLRDIRRRQPDRFAGVIEGKQDGRGTIRFPHTMIGLRRLDNLERCAERIFACGTAGDFLEAGVCQGGAAIFLRALQVAHDQPERRLWAADTFEGLPAPRRSEDAQLDLTEARAPWLACDVDTVRDHFLRYGLLDGNVHFLRGRFSDTLPSAPVERLALLRLDGDLYESTWDTLVALYDKVSPGGFVVVDDYHVWPNCRHAVDEFRRQRQIREPLRRIDFAGTYWEKPAE